MSEWKCPIDSLDSDIREVVRVSYENNMRPYMSCSGSYRDHRNKGFFPECAGIEILDSELTRELIAVLISDKRFKCSIAKERGRVLYDNYLPLGLRFKIDFANVDSSMQDELLGIIQSVIQGRRAERGDRKRVDAVCDTINTFETPDDRTIIFGFNDQNIVDGEETDDNYSLTIRDRRRFDVYAREIEQAVDDFKQDDYGATFYGKDFYSMVAALKKFIQDYEGIPRLRKGEGLRRISTRKRRTDKFTADYEEKKKIAQQRLDEEESDRNSETISFDITDLTDFFEL